MEINVLLGNIFNFAAIICDFIANSRKTKKEVLTVQYFSLGFYSLVMVALNTPSALVQNLLGIVRNYFAIKDKENKTVDWIIVSLCLIVGLVVNINGVLGLLPVIANVTYSVVMITCKDNVVKLKLALIFNMALYAIFNFAVSNIVGVINNVVLIIWTLIFLYKNIKEKKNI